MVGIKLKIVHLYPESLNIYGDTGNVLTIMQRLKDRGIEAELVRVDVHEELPKDADIIIAGGGQDTNQLKVADDLQLKKQQILDMKNEGVVMFVVCGTYQLFGNRFVTHNNEILPGIGVFDLETIATKDRLIGNVTAESEWGQLVGFENHSGQTKLTAGQKPLATVTKGEGNNNETKDEGAISNNAFGTYMHGPFLPKNPKFADELILRALKRRGFEGELEELDDTLAEAAAKTAAGRPR